MPFVNDVFNPVLVDGPGPVAVPNGPELPVDSTRQLHAELAAVGLPVASTEDGATPQFGPATSARLKQFQQLHNLPADGALDPVTGGVLQLTALVASEGDRVKLREELQNSLNQVPNSPEYHYWVARYAIVAGDYALAQNAVRLAGNFVDPGGIVGPILDPGIFDPGTSRPLEPELPHPENFYTYREDLVDQNLMDQLCFQVASLTKEQYAAFLSKPGNNVDPNNIDFEIEFDRAVDCARPALQAISAWQTGNHHAAHREFALAMQSYQESQSFVDAYFNVSRLFGGIQGWLADQRKAQIDDPTRLFDLWAVLQRRRTLLSLRELEQQDRENTIGSDGAFASAATFVSKFTDVDELSTNPAAINQGKRLNPLMVIMATVWIPLAIAEVNCQLHQFDAALQGLSDLLNSQTSVDVRFRYLCEFIEIPFIRLLTLEVLLGKADAQYKIGTIELDATKFPETATYHGLVAAQTYLQVISLINEDGQYASRISQGKDKLVTSIHQALQAGDTTSRGFRVLGKNITVPTISAVSNALPGMDRSLGPHQSIAKIVSPDGQAMRETNPRLYALGLLATARLEQIKAGFNYLGYPDDYVSPWRFQFLLDRARYFSEHAKNAQRDYLNFLNNAEHEELQEQSAAQNVELEKANVRIETARVDQAQQEMAAANESMTLAQLTATDADKRLAAAQDFHFRVQEIEEDSFLSSFATSFGKFIVGAVTEDFALAKEGFTGGVAQIADFNKQTDLRTAQYQLEEYNLGLNVQEAKQAAKIAQAKLNSATSGLVVAGLQRQAAILRHESAVENLNYIRNQTLNADQWFRLANTVRDISDTYLRYAIQLAFLAEQAYEFEADKRINVIRFDYDLSEVGSFLAADFLLRDLDTIEQDLIVNQGQRQQAVRYVLSLAREFPQALQELRDNGRVTFSLRLEQIERRFPGLYNARIGSVDLLPVALMDATRSSVQLRHLGSGQIRLKADPDTVSGQGSTSVLNVNDLPVPPEGWLPDLVNDWPIKIRISEPQTNVYSGLTRQDAAAAFPIASSGQRNAFEGVAAASTWELDLSSRDNAIVPGTLADVLITFVLAGYHDRQLRDAVDQAGALSVVTTSFVSARQVLPDAYYSLVHDGKLDWDIRDRVLTLTDTPTALRNLAVMLPLSPQGVELGRCYCRYPIELDIAADGTISVVSALPQFALASDALTLHCTFTGPNETDVTWDFGDDSPLARGRDVQHPYSRNGAQLSHHPFAILSEAQPMGRRPFAAGNLAARTVASGGRQQQTLNRH